MAKTEIALYGGGFNPICIHHERIAMLIHQTTGMRTWIMPCYDHQFAKDSELIEVRHRWNMVMGVTNQFPDQMLAFDFEMREKHTGSMWEAMKQLATANPDTKFHIVIGMDNANCIESKWDRGEFLIQRYSFIVLHRTGEEPTTSWFQRKHHMELEFDCPISSSDIRTALVEGRVDFARQHLNPMTWDYIESGKLFGLT